MSDLYAWLGALAIACGVCVGTAIDGPSDTEAANDVASDKKTAIKTAGSRLERDKAACREMYGPDAQIFLLDGVHLVCRAAGPVAGVKP